MNSTSSMDRKNRETSRREVQQFLAVPPDLLFAYYNDKLTEVQTWMGDKLGTIVHVGRERRPFGGRVVSVRVHGINGVDYHGMCNLSGGTYCRLRRSRSSRTGAHVRSMRDLPTRLLSETELRRQSADSIERLYNDGRATKRDVTAWVRASAKSSSGRVYEPVYRSGARSDRLWLRRREDVEDKLFAKHRVSSLAGRRR